MSYGNLGQMAGAQTVAGRESTKSEQLLGELNTAVDSAWQVIAKLRDMRERALGSRAEKDTGTGPAPVPAGTVGNLQMGITNLASHLATLHALADELGKVI